MADDDEITELPIDGVLDLHTFGPHDVKQFVIDYLAECRTRELLDVRIIHDKGTGALRRTGHAVLERKCRRWRALSWPEALLAAGVPRWSSCGPGWSEGDREGIPGGSCALCPVEHRGTATASFSAWF